MYKTVDIYLVKGIITINCYVLFMNTKHVLGAAAGIRMRNHEAANGGREAHDRKNWRTVCFNCIHYLHLICNNFNNLLLTERF